MYLSHMNYREVEAYLEKSDTIIIPVGSLENHGLHMPLGTDTIIPDEIARLSMTVTESAPSASSKAAVDAALDAPEPELKILP